MDDLFSLFDHEKQLSLFEDLRQFLPSGKVPIFLEYVEKMKTDAKNASASDVLADEPSQMPENDCSNAIDGLDQKTTSSKACCICTIKPNAPFQAECGHICCYKCWLERLENLKSCPKCHIPVKLRQLKKLYFS